MVALVGVVAGFPEVDGVPDQALDSGSEAGVGEGGGIAHPEGFAAGGEGVEAELAEEPGEETGDCGGEDETKDSAKGGRCEAHQGGLRVAISGFFDGAHDVDIACEEEEEGDPWRTCCEVSENG